jgi:MoaA/NifB/PqqE/SkfB family radical SAM enzyme
VTLVTGLEQRAVRALIWLQILQVATERYGSAVEAARVLGELRRLRGSLRGRAANRKYVKAAGRYFWDLNSPGWPSAAFDSFISAELGRVRRYPGAPQTLQTMMLAITKKCPLRCEHCSEWDALNGRETLTLDDLRSIVGKFQARGVAQLQLSGGEPLRRFDDLLALIAAGGGRTDFWLLTSGYGLTDERARALRAAGLTGVQVSLDHWQAAAHDRFRGTPGSFAWVVRAAAAARGADLAVCFNLCATRAFVTAPNLERYAQLAARLGGGFIQILEPRAVGHYRGADVDLGPDQQALLERFFLTVNHERGGDGLPICTYQAFDQRRIGCYSAGDRFLFVDTDGRAHACPFCQRATADCRQADATEILGAVRAAGCQKYSPVAYPRLPVTHG